MANLFTAPSAPAAVNGPLPGMMAMMQIGDPIETALPTEAVERFRKFEMKRDEAHTLLRAAIESQQELRLEILEHQARIKRLMQHPHEGGFGLADDAAQVISEQQKLDRKFADQRRVNAVYEERSAIWRSTSELVRNIEQAVAARPGGCIGKTVEIETPNYKGSILDAVEARRRRHRELLADLARVRAAPVPSAIVKQRMRQQVADLAAHGRPDVSLAVEIAEKIEWPRSPERMDIISSASDAFSYATGDLKDATALVAWLFQDQLVAAFDREIDDVADDSAALTAEERQKQERAILSDLLATEHEECRLIEVAQAQGVPVDYRVDCDPRAILGFEWVPAPAPVPREGDGQAGVVRRVGP
jgi:hypothetical protein